MSQTLLESPGTVCNNLHDFCNELMVWRDAVVPALNELTKNYRDNRVELHIDFVGAGQRW